MGGPAAADGPFPGDDGQGAAAAFASEDDDFDLDGHFAWLVRELDAGRVQPPPEPPEPAVAGPAVWLSLGDACEVDPELLAAMCGPDGLGGQAAAAAFGQDKAADVLRPGPVLAALTAGAAAGAGSLTDSELIGTLQAGRRLANLADYQQTVVIAEFARRRQARFEAARARGVPAGCRAGEFPGEELAMELVETGAYTGARIDAAVELTARLPRTLAAMAAGTIDLARACTIAVRTRAMNDTDAAYADEVLAAAAPGLRPDQLARKAAALEMKLAPDAVKARKELARQLGQRVEARREESGNASLAGRELGTADVIAAKAHIDAVAARLRDSGLISGTLDTLRALVLVDLTQGRDPLDRIKPTRVTTASPESAAVADELDEEPQCGPIAPGDPAPLPALINLLVPAGDSAGMGHRPRPGQLLPCPLDADETGALIRAASQHPRTRWCFTLTAPDGTAIVHACAKGQHPWKPPDHPNLQTVRKVGETPTLRQSAQLTDLLRRMNVTFEPDRERRV